MNLHDVTLRVIDTETTGLDPERDTIVEIAAVDVYYDDGNWCHTAPQQTLVNPGIPIPAETSAIHHIVDADVAEAPVFECVRRQFLAGDFAAFAAHNASFDAGMCQFPTAPWLCTRRLAMHLWPRAPKHSNQVLRYWLDLDVELPDGLYPHRAAADTLVTAKLLSRELEELESREILNELAPFAIDDLINWANRPAEITYVPFGKHRGKRWREMEVGYLEWVLARDFSADILHTAEITLARFITS